MESFNDWERYKLLIMQEVKDLKDSQKEIREQLSDINTKITVLQVKAVMGAGALSFIMSIAVALIVNYMKSLGS